MLPNLSKLLHLSPEQPPGPVVEARPRHANTSSQSWTPQWWPVACMMSSALLPSEFHVRLSARDVFGIPVAMGMTSSRLSKTHALSGGLACRLKVTRAHF